MEQYSSDNNTHQGTWKIPLSYSSSHKACLFYVELATDTGLFSIELTPNFGSQISLDSPSLNSSLSFWLRERYSATEECYYYSRLFLYVPNCGVYDLLTGQQISSTKLVQIDYNIVGGETTTCGFYYRGIL